MSKEKLKFGPGAAAAIFCTVLAAGGLCVGYQKIAGHFGYKAATLDSETKAKFAHELVSAGRDSGESAERAWLLKHGAAVSSQVMLSVDNTIDQSGEARLGLLSTIYSIGSEDLPDEEMRSWAETLRELASAVLHDGPERSDYIAKSYIMEGRDKDAAAEYARFPTAPQASHFFRQNPFLRVPASGSSQ